MFRQKILNDNPTCSSLNTFSKKENFSSCSLTLKMSNTKLRSKSDENSRNLFNKNEGENCQLFFNC